MKEIVEKIRKKFEKNQIPREFLVNVYAKYNPMEDAEEFVDKALKQFPKLNCEICTAYLKEIIGGEIVRGKYKEHDHTFLMINKGIIDITADQYGGPKVYIGGLKVPWSLK